MKKQNGLLWLMALVLPLFVAACSDSDNSYLTTSLENNTLRVDGNTFSSKFQVESSSEWSLTKGEQMNWLTYELADSEVQLNFTPNDTGKERSGELVLSNVEGDLLAVTLLQDAGLVSDLKLSKEGDQWINYHEQSFDFTIESKVDYVLEIEQGEGIEVTTDKEGTLSSVKLVFDKNTQKDKREATIVVKSGKERKSFTLIQRGQKGFEDVTHQFYMHYATFPVLYTAMDIVQHNKPTWIVDGRNTLKKEEYGANVTPVPTENFTAHFLTEIKQINEENPDAVFGYTAEDIRSTYSLAFFTQLGIDSSRVKINIHPDGTGTYTALYNEKFGGADGEERYKKSYNDFIDYYKDLIADPARGKEVTDKQQTDNWYFPHIFARCSNVRYYIQNKDYLISKSQYVLDQIPLTNYVVKTPIEILQSLTQEQQDQFFKLVGFDPVKYRALFDESPKKNLIILGTNTKNNPDSEARQARYVQKVIDHYGKEYDIFFKAHPADPAYVDYEEQFPGLRLILPARMPFEVFTWALDDKLDAIGGFSTTAFLSMPTDKIKFIFSEELENMNVVFQKVLADRDDILWIK